MFIRRIISFCLSVIFFLNMVGCGTVASNESHDPMEDVKIEKIPGHHSVEEASPKKDEQKKEHSLGIEYIIAIPMGIVLTALSPFIYLFGVIQSDKAEKGNNLKEKENSEKKQEENK